MNGGASAGAALRSLEAPFAKLADTHELANNAQGLVLPVVEVAP
jgi:hypothetical protein